MNNNLTNTGERLLTESFDRYTLEHLHRYAIAMSLCKNLEVLDIASGEGYGSNLLASVAKAVHGVDISEDAIEHAKAKYIRCNLDYVVGAANLIPLPPKSVDRVISFETLEHHDLHEEMFSEIKRVMRTDGLAIISTPDKLNYSDIPKQNNEFHVKELYLEEFRTLAQKYFKHVVILYQEVGYFGIITPETPKSYPFCYYNGDFDHVEINSTIPKSVYNICLASDTELPEMMVSVYSGHIVLDAMLEQLIKATSLQTILKNAHSEIRDLTTSQSYLIGRAITYPYRLIRNIIKQQ
ncbi:MAG: class I SAM-dependent methyltransferase [Methylococcaceae bacterium]